MVINKKASKIWNFFVSQIAFLLLKFVGIVFVSAYIISSQIITESSIILAKHLPFLKLHIVGF